MKTDLTPKYVMELDDTVVLWFQVSNRYTVVSKNVYRLIEVFLSADDKTTFTDQLQITLNIDEATSFKLFNEISNFLEEANRIEDIKTTHAKIDTIPDPMISKDYQIQGTTITINFGSEAILRLFHPPLEHLQVTPSNSVNTVFDIFQLDDRLHMCKNKQHVKSYSVDQYHFLQGQFAMEFTNLIHETSTDNWVASFHASTVSNGKEAIMIIGNSGNGKSTLTALLMAEGFDVLADDFTPFYEDAMLYAFPAAISVKQGAFNMLSAKIKGFENLTTYKNGTKNIPIKYVPPISEIKGGHTKLPCRKIVSVKYAPSKPSLLEQTSAEKALETLIPDSWVSPHQDHAFRFLEWLKSVTYFQLDYSDNDYAIAEFKSLFDA
ncbi:MAG: hypothetical protein GYB32_08320 [Algicola sp.]|nr:hypothetical protein [Algicola sp.]